MQRVVVAVDDRHLLGPGEQASHGAGRGPGRNRVRVEKVRGLITLDRGRSIGGKFRGEVRLRVGKQGRGPIFVGNSEPAFGIIEVGPFFFDRFVALLLHGAVEHADEAFVQDVVAERLRHAMAGDQPVGIERHGRRALVADAIFDGEQVLVVNPDGAMELESLAVVVDERHRMSDLQRTRSVLAPHRLGVGQLHGRAGCGDPAELGVEWFLGPRGRQQHDDRRIRIDGLAIFDQREIVEPRAAQIDRSPYARRVDLDARRRCNHLLTRLRCGG